jgi:hypothetical protein
VDSKKNDHQSWINPLLMQLDLARSENDLVDFRDYWTQLEEYRLPERIRQIVAGVNGTAGYHVLELLDFLPPQRTVLRITFTKQHTEHIMELVLRERGPAVKFYSLKKPSNSWGSFFTNPSRTQSRTTFLEEEFHAAEILDDSIQSWFSYLLSGFEKKFKPDVKKQVAENSELRISAAIGKASA